ncbi:MAG: hypothetical protein AABX24_02770 [Nanoarchaeota archaeon]
MVESKVKSDLQQRLEAEGFEFLTNEYLNSDFDDSTGFYYFRRSPKTDLEIKTEYISRGFSSVLVTYDAYDIKGKTIKGMAAVYVKRKNN